MYTPHIHPYIHLTHLYNLFMHLYNLCMQLKEGSMINKSLLTLGTLISELARGAGKAKHLPFRSSKLTRLLSNALGGNSKTTVVCAISPARSNYNESRNTLLFATRCQKVVTKAKKNQINVTPGESLLETYVLDVK